MGFSLDLTPDDNDTNNVIGGGPKNNNPLGFLGDSVTAYNPVFAPGQLVGGAGPFGGSGMSGIPGLGGLLGGGQQPMPGGAPGMDSATQATLMAQLQTQLGIANINADAMQNVANTQLDAAQAAANAGIKQSQHSAIGMIIGAAMGAHQTTEQIKQMLPHESGAATIKSWELAQKWNTTLTMKNQGYQDVAINYALNNKDGRALFRDPQWNAMKMAENLKKDTLTNLQMFGVKSDKNPNGVAISPEDYIELMSFKPASSILQVDPKVAEQRNKSFADWEAKMRADGMGLIVDMYKNPQLAGTSILAMRGPEPIIDPSLAPLLQAISGGDPLGNSIAGAVAQGGNTPSPSGTPSGSLADYRNPLDKPINSNVIKGKTGKQAPPAGMEGDGSVLEGLKNKVGGTSTSGNFDPSKPFVTTGGVKRNIGPEELAQIKKGQADFERKVAQLKAKFGGNEQSPQYRDAYALLVKEHGAREMGVVGANTSSAQQAAQMNAAWEQVMKGQQLPNTAEIKKLQEMGVIDKYGMINGGALMSFIPPELTAPPEFSVNREIGDQEKAMLMDEYNKFMSMDIDPKNIKTESLGQGVTRKTLLNADGTIAGSMMEGYMTNAMGESVFVSMSGTRLQHWYDQMSMINGLGPLFPSMKAPVTDSELNGTFEPGFWDSQPGAPTYKPMTASGQNSKPQTDPRMQPSKAPTPTKKTSSSKPSGYTGVSLAGGY